MDGGESVQDFFGDWCAFEGRSDVGYYLGAELVYALAENRSPQQLADLNPDEVYGMPRSALTEKALRAFLRLFVPDTVKIAKFKTNFVRFPLCFSKNLWYTEYT